jgi:hypothetical protein
MSRYEVNNDLYIYGEFKANPVIKEGLVIISVIMLKCVNSFSDGSCSLDWGFKPCSGL